MIAFMNLPLKTIVFYFYLLYTVIVLGACVGLNNAVLRCNGTEHLHLSFFFFLSLYASPYLFISLRDYCSVD